MASSNSSTTVRDQTAFINANEKSACSRCGTLVRTSNMARHMKSKSCASVSSNPTASVRASVSSNPTASVQSGKMPCAICGKLFSSANIRRHENFCNEDPDEAECVSISKLLPEHTNWLYKHHSGYFTKEKTTEPYFEDDFDKQEETTNVPDHKTLIQRRAVKRLSLELPPPTVNKTPKLNIPDSPVYNSPLHFPESPTYSPLSPTDNIGPKQQSSRKQACDLCRKLVDKSQVARHRRSKACISGATLWRLMNEGNTEHPAIETLLKLSNPPPVNRLKACDVCGKLVDKSNLARHKRSEVCQPRELPPTSDAEIVQVQTAFKGRLKTYLVQNPHGIKDPSKFIERCKPSVTGKIESELVKSNNLKVNLVFHADFKRLFGDKEITQTMNFKTANEILYPTSSLSDFYDWAQQKILKEMMEFEAVGSQWTLKKIQDLEVRINRYTPFGGSSYMELPKQIQSKKAVVNVKNTDQKCFMWSVLAALHPVDVHAERTSNYKPFLGELAEALSVFECPMKIDDIPRFEKRSGISINVYAYDENFMVYPHHVTSDEISGRHVNLLYIKDKPNTHYCWIKDMSRLVKSQLTKHKCKTWLCNRCLLHFESEQALTGHKLDCNTHAAVRMQLPNPGDTLQFKDYNCSMRVPFVFYADFECCLTPISTCQPPTCSDQGALIPYTNRYQIHNAVSFSLYGTNGKLPVNYFGTDAARKFVRTLLDESIEICERYSYDAVVPMKPLTEQQQKMFENSTSCHICGKSLGGDRVRDHDHLTGDYRGAAHNKCNLNFKKPKFIPVFIHNLAGYDLHLFIREFDNYDDTIKIIPNNEERYISFTVKVSNGIELRFLDSFKFMSQSLDKLASNLSREQLTHTTQHFKDEPRLELLLRKGIYPYDYMDSLEKYNETTLPTKNDFYNRLNKQHITDKDYKHACDVWTAFDIKDMKEYTMLYNQTDVLLLADVMENFRDVCIRTYELDPAWFFTAPGLAWSAMLKITDIKLDLLSDIDMILMIEKGIRGGISQCSNRHAKANNPYMNDYDSTKPHSYLMYLDANNLYGWAMSQCMPFGNFKWSSTDIDVMKIADDAPTGYILEVDLEYPKQLHDSHSDLPLAPEHRIPPGSKQPKLLTSLYNKERYVLHYKNLKLYLSLGLKVTRIHRVLSFDQMNWIQPYIDLNTQKRTEAKNDFEKDFYKLMNNSVFGKTMENIRNRVDIRLATKEKQISKWVAKPNFKSRTIFTENLVAVHFSKKKLVFNKPIYVGMSILDVSKTLMYDFHYNVMKNKYGKDITLQYTDTDSLTYNVQTQDFYRDMSDMIEHFDTSDFPNPNPYLESTKRF